MSPNINDIEISLGVYYRKLWEFDKVTKVGDRTVRTHITNLRHKLKAAGMLEDFIETVYGIGYRLGSRKN